MTKVIFELTIPKSGSWNGKFSGSGNKYTVRKTLGRGDSDIIDKNFWYDWGDGWSANVKVRLPEFREKVTNNFMGYEWMIRSIISNKKILKPER